MTECDELLRHAGYCTAVPRVYLAGPPSAEEYRARASALARAAGWEPVDPMRRDFRGRTEGNEAEIVVGDLADIDSCDVVLAAFTAPDEGTAMEAWYAHTRGIPVVVYTGCLARSDARRSSSRFVARTTPQSASTKRSVTGPMM
jgi:nucleoside 2-deoxyribosyltransferase